MKKSDFRANIRSMRDYFGIGVLSFLLLISLIHDANAAGVVNCNELKSPYIKTVFNRLVRAGSELHFSEMDKLVLYTECFDHGLQDLNAWAVGTDINIHVRWVEVLSYEDEIAAILSHEIAHSILGHNAEKDSADVSAGTLSQKEFYRKFKAQERAADALSIEILVQAKYNPNG